MTEIEKMYENCNFEKSMGVGSPLALHPFTAEKQIELIKLLGKRSNIGLDIFSDNETYFYSDYDGIDGCFEYRADGETFEEALAHIVNDLWQSLTDQEKEEIRGILK